MAVVRNYSITEPFNGLNVALWIAQIGLAAVFGIVGLTKLTLSPAELAATMPWTADAPLWLVRFIGMSEVLGAAGLVLPTALRIYPRLTVFAAAGLTTIMILAAAFHISRGEYQALPLNFVLGGLAVFIGWGRAQKVPVGPQRVARERESDSPRRS